MKTKIVLILGVAVVALSAAILISRGGGPGTELPKETTRDADISGKPKGVESASAGVPGGTVEAGAPDGGSGETQVPKTPPKLDKPKIGTVQPVKGNSSPQAASVLEALKNDTHPERLSLMHPPTKKFDQAAFEADPSSFLNVVEPGRVFMTKPPGKDVPALKVSGDGFYRVKQGGTVKLSAQGAPLAPVTFTSTDLGAFAENNLNSVTVRADEKGLATVTFVATPGTINDVNIMAGSPLASGQAHFVVNVEMAQVAAKK